MNQKGVSLLSLVITIIVIILLAAITINSGISKQIDEANKAKFQNDLKNLVTAVEVYHNRADIHGISSYDRDELKWNGKSERAEKTAKMEDKTQVEEDSIKYIFGGELPKTLLDIVKIESGEVVVDRSKNPQIEWAAELYPEMNK